MITFDAQNSINVSISILIQRQIRRNDVRKKKNIYKNNQVHCFMKCIYCSIVVSLKKKINKCKANVKQRDHLCRVLHLLKIGQSLLFVNCGANHNPNEKEKMRIEKLTVVPLT